MLDSAQQHLSQPWESFEHLPLGLQAGCRLRWAEGGRVGADWLGCELSSVFQPIFDPAASRVAGVEAFLRIPGSGVRSLSPWKLFSTAADDYRLMGLDRLSRTLHLLNALAAGVTTGLFLNVHGRLLAAVTDDHGKAFRRVVDTLGVDPAGIVIETPLAASEQLNLLEFVLDNYRKHGFKVAVNVASAAQWVRLARIIEPDFLKVDSRLLGLGEEGEHLLALLTQRRKAVLILTHLETPLVQVVSPGLWLQGFAYGQPKTLPARG